MLAKLFSPRQHLKDKLATSMQVRAALSEATTGLATLQARYDELESQRVSLAGEDDTARRKFRTDLAEAREDVADAEALVAALQEKLDTVIAHESEAAKRKNLDIARTAIEGMRGDGEAYNRAGAIIAAIIRKQAIAQQLIDIANADLPEGESRLHDAENYTRTIFGQPERTLSDDLSELWAKAGTGGRKILEEDQQRLVHDNRDGTGVLQIGSGRSGHQSPVEKYRYRRLELLVGQMTNRPEPLWKSVNLPGFRADDPPAFEAPIETVLSASGVLAHLDRLAAASRRSPAQERTEIRLTPIGPVDRPGKRLIAAE